MSFASDREPAECEPREKSRILIVDDELRITRVLSMACTAQGYSVKSAADGTAALELLKSWAADLIVTDLSMPNLGGVELCREVRKLSQIPILVLSVRDQEKVKIQALDAGADDYITKPFQMDELLARIRAALRRASYAAAEDKNAAVVIGDFRIDPASHQVYIRGEEIHLTPKEFDLLYTLALHPDRVLTHRVLLTAVWGGNNTEHHEALRVLVAQVRRKIEPGEKPFYIVTEPWVGYRFLPDGAT